MLTASSSNQTGANFDWSIVTTRLLKWVDLWCSKHHYDHNSSDLHLADRAPQALCRLRNCQTCVILLLLGAADLYLQVKFILLGTSSYIEPRLTADSFLDYCDSTVLVFMYIITVTKITKKRNLMSIYLSLAVVYNKIF